MSSLKSDLESKTLKLNLLKEKMKRNSNIKVQDRHITLESEINILEGQTAKLKESLDKLEAELKDLKEEKKSMKNNKGRMV